MTRLAKDFPTVVEFMRLFAPADSHSTPSAFRCARWRRLTEERAGGTKSVFHFDVRGSVAKSTHAGIP